jgi:hypothetical protein
LSGDQQYAGQKGTISTRFEGVAFPLSSPHQVGRGRIGLLEPDSFALLGVVPPWR